MVGQRSNIFKSQVVYGTDSDHPLQIHAIGNKINYEL